MSLDVQKSIWVVKFLPQSNHGQDNSGSLYLFIPTRKKCVPILNPSRPDPIFIGILSPLRYLAHGCRREAYLSRIGSTLRLSIFFKSSSFGWNQFESESENLKKENLNQSRFFWKKNFGRGFEDPAKVERCHNSQFQLKSTFLWGCSWCDGPRWHLACSQINLEDKSLPPDPWFKWLVC